MKKIITLLLSISIIAGCSSEGDVVESETTDNAAVDNDEVTKEEEEYITPEEFAENTSNEHSEVSYDATSKTFTFKLPALIKYELSNENNDFYTDEEYEKTIESIESEMIDTARLIMDYYGDNYTVIFQIDNDAKDTLFKVEGQKITEKNLDMRQVNNSQSKFSSDIDKQQYELVGDYIYIDFRNYVDQLEVLITDFYNNSITEDVFVEELGKGHTELNYYCSGLLQEGDGSGEIVSDDISELASNSFLSCITLRSAYFNLMLPTSDGVEAGSLLEEAIEYFGIAKDIYDSY